MRGWRAPLTVLALLLGPLRAGAAEIELIAPTVVPADAPVIDGRRDRVWDSAPAVRLTLGEGSQGTVEVTVRALSTDRHLYLLVEWPDRTESRNRSWELSPAGWKAGRGREDRLNIAWSIADSVREFPAQGCQALCHKTEGVMRTGAPGEKIDLWYWMAQRTDTVGVADNWVMGHEPVLVDGQKTARRPDVAAGAPFEPNWDEAGRRPMLTFKPGVRPGPVLLKKDAVPVPAAARFKPGARLPREVLSAPTGPRAAIEARGQWNQGRWTVELGRALTTGSPDDVQLAGPGPFFLAISIHDDADRDEHAHMGRDVLRLLFR